MIKTALFIALLLVIALCVVILDRVEPAAAKKKRP